MSEPKAQQPIAHEFSESKAKLEEIEELRKEIRRSRLALIDSLNDPPESVIQKTEGNEIDYVDEEKKQAVELSLSTEKEEKKVLITSAEVQDKEEFPRTVRISGRREIEEVFYGDSYHPRSLSPQQRLIRNETPVPVPMRDISQSTILPRANRNSLTPTKITFFYQNKPSNSVAYIHNEHIVENERKNSHLKESIVKEVIVRHPSPPIVVHREFRHCSPPQIRHPSPNQIYYPTPETHAIREFDDSRKRVVTMSSSSLQKYKPTTCKIQASGKQCKLCQLTRSHLKGVRQMKFTSVPQSAPREVIVAEEEPIKSENQCQANQINNSPGKTKERPYLSTEDKYSCRRSLFLRQDEPKIKRERLNHDFLKSMDSRNKIIQMELDKLNQPYPQTPVKIARVSQQSEIQRNGGRTRKKIFETTNMSKSNPFIRIEDGKQPGHLTYSTSKSVCYVRGLPRERTYSQIHGFSPEIQRPLPLLNERNVIVNPGYRSTIMIPTPVYQQRVVTRSPAFAGKVVTVSPPPHPAGPAFTRTLTPVKNERIVMNNAPIIVERIVAPAQQREKATETREVVSSRLNYGLLKDRNNFVKQDTSIPTSRIQSKLAKIPQFELMEMSSEVKCWYQTHKREIDYQAERICSYDLIKRYMSNPEIAGRLQKMMVDKVEPKRWLLLMVDEVYAKLKDRYVPISS